MFTMDFVLYIVSIFLLSLSIMHFRSSVLLLILYSIYIQMLSTDVFESNIMLRVFFYFLFFCLLILLRTGNLHRLGIGFVAVRVCVLQLFRRRCRGQPAYQPSQSKGNQGQCENVKYPQLICIPTCMNRNIFASRTFYNMLHFICFKWPFLLLMLLLWLLLLFRTLHTFHCPPNWCNELLAKKGLALTHLYIHISYIYIVVSV